MNANEVHGCRREWPIELGAHVPDLPGCIAVAESRGEALDLIREAIELHIEELRRTGQTVPAPRSESEMVEVASGA